MPKRRGINENSGVKGPKEKGILLRISGGKRPKEGEIDESFQAVRGRRASLEKETWKRSTVVFFFPFSFLFLFALQILLWAESAYAQFGL